MVTLTKIAFLAILSFKSILKPFFFLSFNAKLELLFYFKEHSFAWLSEITSIALGYEIFNRGP